jgi:geranylgeranyl pyrophosphate synthase
VTYEMSNDAQSPRNVFAAQQRLLRERLHLLLAKLHPKLRSDVILALEGESKLLSQPHNDIDTPYPTLPVGVWPLLTLLVAQYVSPDIDPVCASNVAIAIECFVCALDLLDDIEDDDQTPVVQALGAPRVLNVSTTLLMLAQQAILDLSNHGIAPTLILRLLSTLQESALIATTGQHQDILAEQRLAQDLTREECIEIATAKAGSIMRLACRIGALCAGASASECEQFSELGNLLGIAYQLDNDAHDLYDLIQAESPASTATEAETTTRRVKSDLIRRKKTLPVVLAARTADTLQRTASSVDDEKKEYLRTLREGILTTWGICLLYRERAYICLQQIEAQKPIAAALRLLLGFE